jgi:uncharacterized membrane protein
MDKMLAIVFNDEKAAYEGTRALAALNAEGSIEVDAAAVIKKNADGTVSTKQVDGDFPIQTFAGTAIGAVLGVLAGPVGIAAGATAGAWAGMIGDLYTTGVDADFISEVSNALSPGKCAVVAEVEEEWVTPVDTKMETLGGVVYRTPRSSVEEEQAKRETAAARAQLDQLKKEHAQARADRKVKLQAQIDALSNRVNAKVERAQTRSDQITREFQARVQALQQRADKERGDTKALIEARIAKLRAEYQHRPHA